MNFNSGSNLVEGFGDEVIVTTGILIATFLIIFVTLIKFKRLSTIHPSSQDDINSARRQLNIIYSNRFFDPSPEQTASTVEASAQVQDSRHYGMDSQCPVCLNEPHFPVGELPQPLRTNCLGSNCLFRNKLWTFILLSMPDSVLEAWTLVIFWSCTLSRLSSTSNGNAQLLPIRTSE